MRFSGRLPSATETNALARLLAHKRQLGSELIDLTVSNPTLAGIVYPEAALLSALSTPGAFRYAPDPRGLRSARAAVASDPEDVLLTASTSEAYSLLFKLLCDPGDTVLVPEPSYPLFAYLGGLEGVRLSSYRLAYDGTWHIDFSSLESRGARAILVVSPGNPTGAYLKKDELARLAAYGLPLIVDEVFAPYALDADADIVVGAARPDSAVLTFSLGGLSKSAGLPQLKLGWIIAGGRDRRAALDRLELIADTYLSVGAPVQHAAPALIGLGATMRQAILARLVTNRARLAAALPPEATLLRTEGGWSAIVRFPSTHTDEELALGWLAEKNVLVQPGYFYDLAGGTFVVLSLLTPPDRFAAGLAAILSP